MAIRLSGMNSGLDTDSIISELVKAKSVKKEKLVKQQTSLKWKQDAWKELNTKIYALYSKTLDNMRSQGDYSKKNTSVSNDKAVSVITGDKAVNSVQQLQVLKLAKAGYLTGAQLKNASGGKAEFKEDTKLADMGIAAGSSFNVTVAGKQTEIKIDADTTVQNLVMKLNSAGVNASFDEKNQRFFVSAKETGEDNDFILSGNNAGGLDALNTLGIITKEDILDNEEYKEWAALQGATDADTLLNIKDRIDAETAKRVQALKDQNESLTKRNEALTKDIATYRKQKSDYMHTEPFKNAMKEVDPSGTNTVEDNLYILKSRLEAIDVADKRQTELEAKTDPLTADEQLELDALKAKAEERATDKGTSLNNQAVIKSAQDFEDYAKEAEKMVADNNTKMAENQVLIDEPNNTTIYNQTLTDLLNKVNASADALANVGNISNSATRIAGQDSEIILNGATFTNANNTFEINGLTITAKAETGAEVITLTTANDTEGSYDMIKNFLKEYNALMKEMDKLYGAESSKGYEPLTSEEKDAMSDTEIADWEKKIKESLFRRDSDLSAVAFSMRQSMSAGFKMSDGTQLYLSDFGISQVGYLGAAANEKNIYHIDGDKDDPSSMNNDDKLKGLIANDPEKVAEFFSGITKNLYAELDKTMKNGNDFKSMFTMYNDKAMQKEYDDYTKKIKAQEEKIKAFEDKYYRQFSRMEVAMSKLNSTQSALSGMFGG